MLLTEQETADKLKITKRTVMELCRKKKLPCIKVGKFWRIDEERLDNMISNKTKFHI